jgi:hypothetical protein
MSNFRGWVKRLEGRAAGDSVSVPQLDGSVEVFKAERFWLGLFVAQANAAAGVVPTGPVPDAIRSATPRTIERIEALAASGDAGSFMRRAMDFGGLLAVAEDAGDLSE